MFPSGRLVFNFTKRQNSRPTQIESMYRQQFQTASSGAMFSQNGKNNAGKEENAGLQHFLLFPQCF